MTIVVAALPISEVRGAIPLAIGVYGLPAGEAFSLAVMGNLLPVIPLLLYLGPVSSYLRRFSWGDRFFTWLFARTRKKYIREHEGFGLTALDLFVAWTGCALAFLVGFRFWPAFAAIAVGVLIAAAIVTAAVMGVSILVF
jgi:uncharacterized membrane protein